MTSSDRPGGTPGSATGAPEPDWQRLPQGTGAFGLKLFLASLSMLFGATMIGYLVVRFSARAWPPAGMHAIPPELAVSTVIIVVSSVFAQMASNAAQHQREAALRRALWITFALGIAFLVSQTTGWLEMLPDVQRIGLRGEAAIGRPAIDPAPRQFAFLFYTLTVLHGLHVLGGLVAVGLVLRRSLAFRKPALIPLRVRHAVVYWHFLGIVWIVMYAVLLV